MSANKIICLCKLELKKIAHTSCLLQMGNQSIGW